jgi:hypothetical protein
MARALAAVFRYLAETLRARDGGSGMVRVVVSDMIVSSRRISEIQADRRRRTVEIGTGRAYWKATSICMLSAHHDQADAGRVCGHRGHQNSQIRKA